jgi:hypothetical protein
MRAFGLNDEEVAVHVDDLGAALKSTIDEFVSKAGTLGTTLHHPIPSNIIIFLIFLIFTVGHGCIRIRSGGSGCVDTNVGRVVAIGDGRINERCISVIGKGRKQGCC